MTVAIVILCRYESSRLPGKILRVLQGRPVLMHIVARIRRSLPDAFVVVATSELPSDNRIADYCRSEGVACFRGSLDDVAGRFLAAAKSVNADIAVRINGDNVLLDGSTLRQIVEIAGTGLFDFVSNVPGRTFPYGMSVEAVSVPFYERHLASMLSPADREHVTKYLYDHPAEGRRFVYENTGCPEARGLKLALDTPEDFQRIDSILSALGADAETAPLSLIADAARSMDGRDPWKGRHGPLLIAEIGGNHEGDFAAALRLASLAISCGVDFVKFQLYRGDTLVSPVEAPDRNKHFKKFELSREQHLEIARLCRDGGVGYMASVWDLAFLEWIDEWMPIYKIGSGDLTARPIVREFARRGKPMIVATGVSTLADVLAEVDFIQSVNPAYRSDRMLALLQCTSMYPIPDSDANLAVMETLRRATGLAVGYSSHTEGGFPLRVAAAKGARVLEFHFTDRREGQAFRDHKVSLMPDEVHALQVDLDRIQALTGDGIKQPQPSELATGHVTSFRRAVYPARDISTGERIQESDLICLRPNHGIDAREFDCVAGKMTTRDIMAFERITWQDLTD